MSTRVQKGGQKFKPVAKPRTRLGEAPSRQASKAPDSFHGPQTTTPIGQNSFRVPTHELSLVAERTDGPSSGVFAQHPSSGNTEVSERHQEELRDRLTGETYSDGDPRSGGVTWTTPLTQTVVLHQEVPRAVTSSAPPIVGSSKNSPIIVSSRDHSIAQPRSQATPESTQDIVPTLLSILRNLGPEGDLQSVSEIITSQPLSDTTLVGTQSSMSQYLLIPTDSQLESAPADAVGGAQQGESSSQPARNVHEGAKQSQALIDDDDETASENRELNRRNKRNRDASSKTTVESTESESQAGSQRYSHGENRMSTTRQPTGEHLDIGFAKSNASEPDIRVRRKKRQRSSTVASSRRRSDMASVPPIGPDADPGEELDPTVVTMAAICNDTGQGRVSSKAAIIQRNHLAWKAVNKEKRAKMRAKMEAKKHGRKGDSDDEVIRPTQTADDQVGTSASANVDNGVRDGDMSSDAGDNDASGSGFNYKETLATNRFTVQVRIGPNGETIIDEESLHVDRVEEAEDNTEQYTHIEESDQTKFVNSASFSRKSRGSRWSAEETELFYDALSQFGENYELISYVLAGRDRKACKNKFKAEDKKNPNRITYCLNNRIPYDMQTLSRMTGKDFSGPTPEIRAPAVLTLVEEPEGREERAKTTPSRSVRKKSRTPAAEENGVEVLGDVEEFNLDEVFSDDEPK